jgi:hypothetical protein
VLIALLVIGLVIATLGLGHEGHAAHGPMPAPLALEAR